MPPRPRYPMPDFIRDTLNKNKLMDLYTQGGHKLRFFKGGKAQFVTVGIISFTSALSTERLHWLDNTRQT